MPPLRLGLLGTGLAARQLYWPALKPLGRKIALVACANRTRSKAEAFAAEAGIPTVVRDAEALFALPGLEAVLISLPIADQPRYVLQALAAGIPVLSEKPVAPSYAAGRRLLAQARPFLRRGPVWMVAENYHFLPAVDWCEERLARGELGDVRLIEVRQSGWTDATNPYFHTAWRTRPEFEGGFVLDAGVHLAYVVRRLFGMPVEVKGLSAQFNPDLPPMDTALAVLRFSTGAVGTWISSFSAAAGGPLLAVRGSKASLELHQDHAVLSTRAGAQRRFGGGANSYARQFEHFAESVRTGARPSYGPVQGVADLALIESIVKGRRVGTRG